MDNKDKIEPNDDLLIVELDDRLEFSALPVDVMNLQVNCINGSGCPPHNTMCSCGGNIQGCLPAPIDPPGES